MRRGMTVEGLQEFVLTQGMSKARAVNKQQPLRKPHWHEICQWGIFSTGRFEYLSSPRHFRLARELDKFERLWLQSLQGNQHDGVGQDLGHQQAEAATPWISSWYGPDYIIVTNGDLIWFDAAVLTTWWSFRAEDWSCSAAVCSCCWWCSDGPIFFTTKCLAKFDSFLFWYVAFSCMFDCFFSPLYIFMFASNSSSGPNLRALRQFFSWTARLSHRVQWQSLALNGSNTEYSQSTQAQDAQAQRFCETGSSVPCMSHHSMQPRLTQIHFHVFDMFSEFFLCLGCAGSLVIRKHPKNDELGERLLLQSKEIYIDQEDTAAWKWIGTGNIGKQEKIKRSCGHMSLIVSKIYVRS